MKPVDVSDKDWEEALLTGVPVNKWDSSMPKTLVHVFLQRGERPRWIFLLENGCLVRGKCIPKDSVMQEYIDKNKDRYLGIGVFHNVQE
jgi:hypothetical protein